MSWHYNWTNQPSALNSSEVYENAYECWQRFTTVYGWTQEATAAVIANFQSEGALNPCQWQYYSTIGDWDNDRVGLGLGQWTPPSKLADYMGGRAESYIADGNRQIDFTVSNSGQWVQRVNASGYSSFYGASGIPYITSIAQFSASHLMPEDLATCWCACWEGPSRTNFRESYTTRRTRARNWYNEFGGSQSGYGIFCTVVGNGTAVAIPPRVEEGEDIVLKCIPNDNDQLVSIDGRTATGMSVALLQQEVQTVTMHNFDIFVTATFTGDTPEPPTPPPYAERKKMPLWMMVNRRRGNYIMELY